MSKCRVFPAWIWAIQIKTQYPSCKILLLSGQAATLDLLRQARAQGHHFDLILKPIPPTEFLLEIGKRVNSPRVD
jgi:hypothetical protein